MFLSRILPVILLFTFIQDIATIGEDNSYRDDENYYTSEINGSRSNHDDSDVDVYTIIHEFDTLTSNGVIDIMIDVNLSSIILLRGLQNISIIGYGNPTINCDNAGGIRFEHCNNCTIAGIAWEKCGNKNSSKPAIELCDSSDVVIQNCTFQHSMMQALALSEMSGNVIIDGCKFAFNYDFKDHGVAIYYLPKVKHYSKFLLVVSNSSFTFNRASGRSIVYIGPSNNKSMEQTIFMNCLFFNNQGIPIYISHQNVLVSGNILVKGNIANKSGGFIITNHSNVIFHKSNARFSYNKALNDGGVLYIQDNSNVQFEGNSIITVNNNQAKYGGGFYIVNHSDVTFKGIVTVTINNNHAIDYGGAFCIFNNSGITFEGNSTLQINKNKATNAYGGAIYIEYNSKATFRGNTKQTIDNNQALIAGGAFYIYNNCSVTFEGDSMVTILNNLATFFGGAINIFNDCTITFEGNSIVTVNNGQANYGGALGILNNSVATFQENSVVEINNNQGDLGGALHILSKSSVTFGGNSTVTINHNEADNGGAVYISNNCDVTVEGSSTVTINDNQATVDGGAFYISRNSDVTFVQNSIVTVNSNKASNYGGALCLQHYSNIKLKNQSLVMLYNNSASVNGGALYVRDNSNVIIAGKSTTTFASNKAFGDGGALYANINSVIAFQGKTSVKFDGNKATHYGGVLYLRHNCDAIFEESAIVIFHNNLAGTDGGALYAWDNCNVSIKGNCGLIFDNNEASGDGGALCFNANNTITFQENSTVKFNDNRAAYFGGALNSNSKFSFTNNCVITFIHNKASHGGAIFSVSDIIFKDNVVIQFEGNSVTTLGGALHTSDVTFKGNTTVTFNNNDAVLNGGALYSGDSSITMKQNSTVTFTNNSAENGGAVFISACTLLVSEYSNVILVNNTAGRNGGAIHFNNQIITTMNNSLTITLISNTARNHGGAIYSKITQSVKYFNISKMNFNDNTAGVAGNLWYVDVAKSCNDSCLADRMVGVNTLDKGIATSPKTLKLYYPAKFINNNTNASGYDKYYISNIMLGQELTINTCLLDYYNKPAEVTQFKIIGESHQNYFIYGSEYISISCNHTIKGISIIGKKAISDTPLNYSILFTSYIAGKYLRKIISVNLTIELSPCHYGFQYNNKSQICECYTNSDIVYCSGDSSAIKRGYWFGNVKGILTVTFCPINYCNFTCCKTTNGYYHLSPVRVNQCRSHRSGTACGSCEEGYTLSFDSAKCISINKCIPRDIILVVTLTVIYWFAVVVAVFIVMYYQVGIGYFYAVAYYYSVVDILLSQHTDISNGLYRTVTITSSIAKITPQFLGRLCLIQNISGIDQQFIHYVHPLAVSVILVVVSWLARNSKTLSLFISRGIIRAICFLLLLSYTSVATTSLLLMRSLKFVDIDNIYTYLSPDIQYFHGRHLVYGIIAIIFTLLIVIGLPLLLLLEPFLNGKINFVRIKPLLDQFQGCYKDKYRWFAAYYMICRLIIITIIIANLSEAFISRYLLIIVSTIMALVHLVVRPYIDNVLNMSDGAILQLMVLVVALPLFEYFDTYDSSLVIGIAFVLVILPLVQFVVVKVFTSKQTLKKITKKTIKHLSSQNLTHENVPASDVANDNNNASTNFVNLTIDDNMRRNAIICEISSNERLPDIIWCREPFMEVLNEIED